MIKRVEETGSLEDRKRSGRYQIPVAILNELKHSADTPSTSSEYGYYNTHAF